ncbi:DUF4157 domain-containing protein, partial [Coleofasciculus sp. FACHB-501]|uniref:eCIS core domain-containing protein n=1 Tax=Cyanophyceae TaxID=3028117 RepID=UPI00168A3F27
PTLQREVMPEEEEEKELQMKPMIQCQSSEDGKPASPDLEASIQQARGSGQPLAQSIREPMEQAFGADFSGVKIHTDAQSNQLNRSIQAKAFTTGQDIFFRAGAYEPGSRGGQELIAHELTHVVQQNGSAVQRSLQPITPTVTQTTLQPQLIQRNEDHAKKIVPLYDLDRTYDSWNSILAAKDKFLPEQWERIEAAYHLGDDGMPIIRDRSGKQISNQLLNPEEQGKLDTKKQGLDLDGAHMEILTYLEEKVTEKLGAAGLAQFYRGAHIVFQDKGAVYNGVKQLGMPIAAKNEDNSIKSKTEFVGKTGTNLGGYWGDVEAQRAGKMFTRRPENSETSHYQPNVVDDKTKPLPYEQQPWLGKTKFEKKNEGYDSVNAEPQLGIDLPESVKGHILVGIVPTNMKDPNDDSAGHTFIQTEGAGFQNFNEASLAHGQGYLANSGYGGNQVGTQTGLVGKTLHSEKTKTEIREHENANWDKLYQDAQEFYKQDRLSYYKASPKDSGVPKPLDTSGTDDVNFTEQDWA